MSEENKALVRRAWELADNPDILDEVYAPDVVWHEPDQDIRGLEEAKQFISMLLEELKRERHERSQLERAMLESLLIKGNGQQQLLPAVGSAHEPLRPRPWWRRVFGG
jgi:SnoaL-like domain